MRVQARAGGGHQIAGDILQLGIWMVLEPHIEEVRLNIGAHLDRLDRNGGRFAVRAGLGDDGRELSRVVLGIMLKEDNRKVRRLRSGDGRVILDELLHDIRMGGPPISHGLEVVRVRLYPSLGHAVVSVSPLSHDGGSALKLILLKPSFDVRRDRLPGLGTALVSHNGAERAGHAPAQRIVRGCQGR